MIEYSVANETIRFEVARTIPPETRSALAAFCRRGGFAHLFSETLEPMLEGSILTVAMGISDRPWPPKGIGSQQIEAVGIAMVGGSGRALLTPVLMAPPHATNIGLAAAVTKKLLEALRDQKVPSVSYLVRDGDRVLERVLSQSGFGRVDLCVATEFAEYIENASTPDKALDALGLQQARVGDVLSLSLDGRDIDRLTSYHLALASGISAFLNDRFAVAALMPGLLDIIADLPPGGVNVVSAGPAVDLPGGGPVER
jgi:hypothetical protein